MGILDVESKVKVPPPDVILFSVVSYDAATSNHNTFNESTLKKINDDSISEEIDDNSISEEIDGNSASEEINYDPIFWRELI
ncbi:unnamed protein product [Rotaria socialis]|uniref:Uncharacterized protein n=1 Tax=Rotaria socialis TaxID=392032 RepID=A0A820MBS8_9BILA|nr:unnamed protein product [Rotaria socialis]